MLRQAFVEGHLRPIEASFFDPNWWRKVRWTIDWLDVKNTNEVRKLKHDMNCALLDYFTGDRAVDLHWEQAINIQNLVQKDLMPWRKITEIQLSRKRIHEMVAQWKAIFGDPDDPDVAEKIRQTAEHLMTVGAGR